MKTIVIASQKGGSAKTTLAAHLAVQAERSGDSPAWLIDTDKQATLTMWHDRREAETPGLFEVSLPRLPQALMKLALRAPTVTYNNVLPDVCTIDGHIGCMQVFTRRISTKSFIFQPPACARSPAMQSSAQR